MFQATINYLSVLALSYYSAPNYPQDHQRTDPVSELWLGELAESVTRLHLVSIAAAVPLTSFCELIPMLLAP